MMDESGWYLAESGWYLAESGWDLAESGWDLAERLEHLTAASYKVVTVLGSIPESSDIVESEGRQMKQSWIKYKKIKRNLFDDGHFFRID